MSFENFLEGLTILNSCLVTGFRFESKMSHYLIYKDPSKAQSLRLKSLGFTQAHMNEWSYAHA